MMVTPKAEKALLQSTVGLASLVPILAGLFGVLAGAHMFGSGTDSFPISVWPAAWYWLCVHFHYPAHRISSPALSSADSHRRDRRDWASLRRAAHRRARYNSVVRPRHGTGRHTDTLRMAKPRGSAGVLMFARRSDVRQPIRG